MPSDVGNEDHRLVQAIILKGMGTQPPDTPAQATIDPELASLEDMMANLDSTVGLDG